MPRPTPRACLSLLLVLALGASACGDDGDGEGGGEAPRAPELTAAEQELADAWAQSLTESEDGFAVDEADADCMGAAIMAEVGVEPFEEAEVTASDIEAGDDSPGELLGAGTIEDEQAEAILDAWEDCTDIAAALALAAVGDFDLDEEGQQCVADGLREDGLARKGLKPAFTEESDEPPAEVLTALVALIDDCSGGSGDGGGSNSVIVDGIASELAADGRLTEEQARCIAQEMVDTIGLDRLIELGAGGNELDNADPEVQQEVAGAVLEAAGTCEVPLNQLGG